MDNNPSTNTQGIQPVRKPKSWRFCGLILLIIIIFVGSGYGFLYAKAKDIAPFEDNELKLEKVNIPDAENSYFELAKIQDVVKDTTENSNAIKDMAEGKNWNEELAKTILSKNAQGLAYLDAADLKPKFVNDLMANPDQYKFNQVDKIRYGEMRYIVNIQAIKVQLLLKQGQKEEAFNENMKILRLAYKLCNAQPDSLQYLVGISIYNIGWKNLDTIITTGNFSSEFLQSKKEELSKLKSIEQGYQLFLKDQYLWLSQAVDSVVSEIEKRRNPFTIPSTMNLPEKIMPRNFYLQPNQTKKRYAEKTKNWLNIDCNNIPTPPHYDPVLSVKTLLTENYVGQWIVDNVDFSGVAKKKCDAENLADQVINKIK